MHASVLACIHTHTNMQPTNILACVHACIHTYVHTYSSKLHNLKRLLMKRHSTALRGAAAGEMGRGVDAAQAAGAQHLLRINLLTRTGPPLPQSLNGDRVCVCMDACVELGCVGFVVVLMYLRHVLRC